MAVESLSNRTRVLTWAAVVSFAALGVVLFLAPSFASTRFAWKVSPFVTMTIGAWSLGTAWMAGLAARDWAWSRVAPVLVYVWSFSILQTLVLLWFARNVLGEAFAWPYFVALGVGVAATVSGLVDLARTKPAWRGSNPDSPGWLHGLIIAFVVFVTGLAVVAAFRPTAGQSLRIFPEVLSRFTVRAFGAFYLSLAIGAAVLLATRSRVQVVGYIAGGMGLLVPITVAAFVYLRVFDFGAHPLQALYLGAYLGTAVLSGVIVAWDRRAGEGPSAAAGATGARS